MEIKSLLLQLLAGCTLVIAMLSPAAAQTRVMLGIELGARFQLPQCAAGEVESAARLCYKSAMTTRKATGADEYVVLIPDAGRPPYVRTEIKVMVLKGVVEAMQIGTWGLQAQDIALEDLTKKYGKPAQMKQEVQKNLRVRIPTFFADWELKEFSVKLTGALGSLDWGRIDIITHQYRSLSGSAEKQTPAKPAK